MSDLKVIIKEALSKLSEDAPFDKNNLISGFYNSKIQAMNNKIRKLKYAEKVASSSLSYAENELKNGVVAPVSVDVIQSGDYEDTIAVVAKYNVGNYSDKEYDELENIAYGIIKKLNASVGGFVDVDGGASDVTPEIEIRVTLKGDFENQDI